MSFAWPWALLALLTLPLLVVLYLRGLRRPAQVAALHPDLKLLAQASARPRPLRRHLPALLYLLATTLALLALARPSALLPLPDNRTAIMLSIDVSLSMNADDIAPSRLAAAQQAARAFVRELPEGARVGLATFSGYAVLNTPPTPDHARVLEAIDGISLGRGTAIGAGLLEALHGLPERDEKAAGTTREARSLPPAAIVLLSDGRNNRGIDPQEAADQVKALAVKVYTVGLGTDQSQQEFGAYSWRGFDSETLKAIAATTGGRYYEADSAGKLGTIYRDLGRSLGWSTQPREVSGFLAALAGLVLLGSLAASEVFTRRIV